jgi:hypothetical protein
MLALERDAVVAFVQILALCLAPAACLWLALHAGTIGRAVGRAARRVVRREDVPAGPPLERIAADIHRIAALIEALPPRAPRVSREAAILAYDDALGAACRALGLDDALRGLPFGPQRDAARVAVEAELSCAGFVLAPDRAA